MTRAVSFAATQMVCSWGFRGLLGSVVSRGGAGFGPHGSRNKIAAARTAWGVFRDRRPDLYAALNRLDGR